MDCNFCGASLSPVARSCPHCGQPTLLAIVQQSPETGLALGLAVLIIFVLGGLFLCISSINEKWKKDAADVKQERESTLRKVADDARNDRSKKAAKIWAAKAGQALKEQGFVLMEPLGTDLDSTGGIRSEASNFNYYIDKIGRKITADVEHPSFENIKMTVSLDEFGTGENRCKVSAYGTNPEINEARGGEAKLTADGSYEFKDHPLELLRHGAVLAMALKVHDIFIKACPELAPYIHSEIMSLQDLYNESESLKKYGFLKE